MTRRTLPNTGWFFVAVISVIAILGFTAIIGITGCTAKPHTDGRVADRHRLVILVPGTFSGDAKWIDPNSTSATFANELKKILGPGDRIMPFRWNGGIGHQDRVQAAVSLARLISNQQSKNTDIVLIGHSHGGNVCLLAAGMSTTEIQLVVCLGTPHLYYHAEVAAITVELPIYASPRALSKTGKIVSVSDPDDRVAEEWSNAFVTGIEEAEAIEAVDHWIKLLSNDSSIWSTETVLDRMFESNHVFASRRLSVADETLEINDSTPRLLGVTPHGRMTSREMVDLVIRKVLEIE